MNRHIRISGLIVTLACLIPSNNLPGADAESSGQTIAASDPRFRYEGRFDKSDPSGTLVIWEASRISLDFDGPTLKLLFSNYHGESFFDATVDGVTKIVELRQAHPPVNTTFSDLGPERHHLTLFKRSEASAGTVRFNGVELAAGAHAWEPPVPAYKTSMQFIGDSIAAGACDEDGKDDQWTDHRTHNSAKSYATLMAAAFDADLQNLSVSGIGIVTGYDAWTEGQIWGRVYADSKSAKADLTQWTPRIVFVHLGENDGSYPSGHHQPFPTNFAEAYIGFGQNVRAVNPNAEIVLMEGGMWNGANNKELLGAWHEAVAKLEASDKKMTHFQFKHWTGPHPRVADHQALADELIAWLKQQDFMK
jgi:lysophospholipase L1-like esterase